MDNAALERQIGERRAELAKVQRAIALAEATPQQRWAVHGIRIFLLVIGLFLGFLWTSEDIRDRAITIARERCP